MGTEHRGAAARKVVRETFAQLGRHNRTDTNFDAAFEERVRSVIERWNKRGKQERIDKDSPDLDGNISLEEVQDVILLLKAGKASGADEILKKCMTGHRKSEFHRTLSQRTKGRKICPTLLGTHRKIFDLRLRIANLNQPIPSTGPL